VQASLCSLDSPQEAQAFIIWFTVVIGKKKKKRKRNGEMRTV
jgi:hypothetical protein